MISNRNKFREAKSGQRNERDDRRETKASAESQPD